MPNFQVNKLLFGFLVFLLISGVWALLSYIALAFYVVWAIGPGPSSRAGSGDVFGLLVIVLTLGFLACQFVGLRMAMRKS
jgi:hypothetical protein